MSADPFHLLREASGVVTGDEIRPLDDDGNALLLADQNRGELRYVIGEGWHAWDGTRWRVDDAGALVRSARDVAELMRCAARFARTELDQSDDRRKAIVAHARRTGSARGISAMIELARSDERLLLRPEHLDFDPMRLNLPNGSIDLRTSVLHAHNRSDYITRRSAAVYDPDAEAPTWTAFLERIQPNEEMRAYLQRMAGAAAVGHNHDELLFVLHGAGANGKTKFVQTIAAALGDYAATTDASLLLAGRRRGGGQPELVRLRGVRLLVAGETEEGERLSTAVVKSLVGGDAIACRLLYDNNVVEFVPVFSPWLVTNHRPAISEQSEAIWRRVRLIPFGVTIPKNERDKTLQGRLFGELPGVLAWIVAGARLYLEEGLDEPDEVGVATESYREDENVVGRFITERCETGEDHWVASAHLYGTWRDWCMRNGEDAGTQTAFGLRVSELRDDAGEPKFPPDRVGQLRVRKGLRVNTEPES